MPRDASDPMASPYEIMTGMNMSVALRVDQIETGHRLRLVDPEKVAALKASIELIGLRTLIAVAGNRSASNDPAIKVRLVAGAHRLEAMRQLGREHIGVVFEDGDDLDAELWEIDENLCRAELTPADRALFVFRRKEIYLMRHPETGHGGERASRQVGDLKPDDTKRFTAATAEATGQSERAIQRDAERGEKISEKALRMLRGTHHDKGVTLDRLKSLRSEEQEVYVKALFEADREKAREAKELRDSKQKLSRSIRTEIIKAIAEKGTMTAGEMPRAAFPVVYADPPWEQESYSDETGQDKGLRYPAMPLDEIKALCAGERSPATRDAILLLWTTASRLKDGLDVMAGWGFAYKSHLVWDKVNIGMGRWVRDRHELLLIGTRGDFPGLIPGTQPHSIYSEAKTEHSVKPKWFASEINRLFPDLPKLELFQRKDSLHFADVRNGPTWSFWGYEAGEAETVADVAPAEPASRLPPAPGPTAPVEFTVGGMRKRGSAKFCVSLNEDGTYLISADYDIAGLCGGASPRTGTIATYETALRLGLAEIGGRFREVIADQSSVCTSAHRAAARGGLKWIGDRLEEWGLGAQAISPPSSPPSAAEPDPVEIALVEGGAVESAYHLRNGDFLANRHGNLPSRLIRNPVEFVGRTHASLDFSRILLRHPMVGEHPEVAPYIAELEEKTGLQVGWEPLDQFGRDRGKDHRYFHAMDLCTDKHWKDLLETRHLTDDKALFRAVVFGLEYKGISVKNARALMSALDAPEPADRSAAALSGKGLWPYQDGKKKYIAPNFREVGANGAWLVIHGIEDGWLAYVGKFLSVTPAGMERRTSAQVQEPAAASEAAE